MVYSDTAVYEGNKYGKSSHLYIFTSLKHLMMLLKCNFQGSIFYTTSQTLIALGPYSSEYLKVETL